MRPCEGPVHGGTCWLDPRGSLGRLAGQIVSEYCPRQSVSQGARDRGHRGRMAAEMLVTGWLYRVGTWTAQHRRRVVVVWVVAVAILIGLAQNLGGEFSEEFGIPGTESYAAQELLEERFPEQSGGSARVVFPSPDGPPRWRPGSRRGAVCRRSGWPTAPAGAGSVRGPSGEWNTTRAEPPDCSG